MDHDLRALLNSIRREGRERDRVDQERRQRQLKERLENDEAEFNEILSGAGRAISDIAAGFIKKKIEKKSND